VRIQVLIKNESGRESPSEPGVQFHDEPEIKPESPRSHLGLTRGAVFNSDFFPESWYLKVFCTH
jgi:hypothetical protein